MKQVTKKFVFISTNIRTVGGAQNYMRNKIKFLVSKGWKVYVLFHKSNAEGCVFEELRDYLGGEIEWLYMNPEHIYGTIDYYMMLSKMLEHIEYCEEENSEYLIETHSEIQAIWGELLAKKVSGKHFFFSLQEKFGDLGASYPVYLDFFKFKFERGEIAGITDSSLHRMFEGYMDVEISDRYKLRAAMVDNLCDGKVEALEKLPESDWNIGYFGRCEKEYFPYILYEVRLFCGKHSTRNINFIVIGTLKEKEKNLLDGLGDIANLTIICLGHFDPIPKQIFEKIDVMIAGAGCARISYEQGTPAVVPNAATYNAAGIYGYTTDSTLYGNQVYSYNELLENVLITKEYLNYPYQRFVLKSCEDYYNEFFEFVEKSVQEKEYYEFAFLQNPCTGGVYPIKHMQNFLDDLGNDMAKRVDFVKWIQKIYGNNIALFGYGKIGKKIVEYIPELKFQMILDNQIAEGEEKVLVERPTEEILKQIETIFISPFKLLNTIKEELQLKKYEGTSVSFVQVITEYLKEKCELS